MKGFLCVISGPSGVGKGTIVKALLKERDDIELSISVTTRYKREGEVDGKDYFFLSLDKFNEMEKTGRLLESACVHDNKYGTPKDFVEEQIEKGKIVILEIDVQGAKQIKANFDNAIYVFVLPPRMKDIEDRLRKRGTEDEDKIGLRIHNSIEEFKAITMYDYFLLNDKVDHATERLNKFLDEEREKGEIMINPSFRELEEISKSRYKIAMMAAKRAKEIIDGDEPLVKGTGVKPVTIAINEIMAGKVEKDD